MAAVAPLRSVPPSPEPAEPVKVLFIAGTGRSGTTLLACMLGQLDGFFAAGEVRYLWRRGLIERRSCGCGTRVPGCAIWGGVLDDLSSDADVDPGRVDREQRRVTRARRLPLALLRHGRSRRADPGREELVENLSRLYSAMAARTGAHVIIDSSKLPTYGRLLEEVPGLDVRVVHLVRDPRATAFSWQRWRELPDGAPHRWMHRQSAAKSAYLWLLWNTATELLWRRRGWHGYLRVRYEDLVNDPQAVADRVVRLMGEPPVAIPVAVGGGLMLRPTHTVAGNPGRFGAGPVRLVADQEWQRALSRRRRWLVSLMTAPVMRHYGYRLRPTAQLVDVSGG